MEQHHTPGVSLAVFDKAGRTLLRCYGVADASSGRPVTPDTIFEAASLSKPPFALMILELAGQGVVDLDRPLGAYLSEPFADDPQIGAITARHVLCHRTGLPNWTKDGEPVKVHATPGTEFGYSGLGYVYLQRAVEQVTGQDFQQLMRRHLFGPLGMEHSSYLWMPEYVRLAATGHDAAGKPKPKSQPAKGNPASSLHSTPREYARFAGLLLEPASALRPSFPETACPQPVSRGSLAAMAEPVSPVREGVSWGLGVGTEETAAGKVLWQWGDNGSFKAFLAAAPAPGFGAVVMTNGQLGLKVCRSVIEACFPGRHPGLEWMLASYDATN
jgi:CubicO group peptidase (beta-lactamase class C family)